MSDNVVENKMVKEDKQELSEMVLEPRLDEENKKLLDALVVPLITPHDPSDDDILKNLENMILGELGRDGEMASVRLLVGVRKTMEAAERLITNGEQRKEAILYVCKRAIISYSTDKLMRDTLLILVDVTVPEVIEMVVDAAKNSDEYKRKAKKGLKKLCSCLC